MSELIGAEKGDFRVTRVEECGVMDSNRAFPLKLPKLILDPETSALLAPAQGSLPGGHALPEWEGTSLPAGDLGASAGPGCLLRPSAMLSSHAWARPPLTLPQGKSRSHRPEGPWDWASTGSGKAASPAPRARLDAQLELTARAGGRRGALPAVPAEG